MKRTNRAITIILYMLMLFSCSFFALSIIQYTYQTSIDNHLLLQQLMIAGVGIVLVSSLMYLVYYAKKRWSGDLANMERIIGTVPTPVFIIDKKKRIVFSNQAAVETFGKDGLDFINKPCSSLKTSNCNNADCAIERFLKQGENGTIMSANKRQYIVSIAEMKNVNGKSTGYIETLQDITELIEVQQQLEERSLELETVSQNLTGGILITAMEEGLFVLKCNQGYLDLLGCKEEDVIGKPAIQWLIKEESEDLEELIFAQLQQRGSVYLEHQLQSVDGRRTWVSLCGKQATLHSKTVGIWLLTDIHERKQNEEKIIVNEQRYRIAAQNTEDIIIDYDMCKDIMMHTDKVNEIYGMEEIVEHPMQRISASGIVDKDSIPIFKKLFEDIHNGVPKASCDILTYDKFGKQIWCHLSFTVIFDHEQKPVRAIGVIHDFTKEKDAVEKYRREAQYRKVTLEDVALYYEADLTKREFITGHEHLINAYADKPTKDFDTIINLLLDHFVYEEDRELVKQKISYNAIMEAYLSGQAKSEFEYRRILGSKEKGWVNCTLYVYEDEDSKNIRVIGFIKDIDEAKKLQLYLRRQAECDLLTGLYNKITAEELISQHVTMQRKNKFDAFMIIDLDDFKMINDSLGHAFGDAVLSQVAQQLKKIFHEEDILGRIGGDEFGVYVTGLRTEAEAIGLAKRICDMFHKAYTGKRNNYKISGSVGVVLIPQNVTTFAEVYQKADIALYAAKKGGKDNYCLYHRDLPDIGTQAQPRGIDNNAGKQFSDNIGEYVLHILYEAKQPENVVNAVLELVAKQYHYSRGYVFEHDDYQDCWHNTFEWCADGIKTQKETFQKVTFREPGYYESMFDANQEFVRQTTDCLEGEMRELVAHMEIQSFAQYAIVHDGRIKTIIGFDDCDRHRIPNFEEAETLHMVTILLDTFVFRERNSKKRDDNDARN